MLNCGRYIINPIPVFVLIIAPPCFAISNADTASNNKMLALVLKSRKIPSDSAKNGREGIESVQAHPIDYYDVIFMDNTMPVLVREGGGVEGSSTAPSLSALKPTKNLDLDLILLISSLPIDWRGSDVAVAR